MSSAEETTINKNSGDSIGNDTEGGGVVSDLLMGAMTTYLQPLLDKHASSNPTLAFEDLLASWHAAERFLSTHKNDKEYGAVLKRVAELHKGQTVVYRDAAILALREFATTRFVLPSVEEFLASRGDAQSGGGGGGGGSSSGAIKEAYVQHACELAMEQRPKWKVGKGIQAIEVVANVKQRAEKAFDSHKSARGLPSDSSNVDVEGASKKKYDDVIGELEGGEIDEDGEVHENEEDESVEEGQAEEDESRGDEAEGGAGSEAAKEAKALEAKKKGGTKRKAPAAGIRNPKGAIRKKVTKAIGQNRAAGAANAPGTNAARGAPSRRGRGGSVAAAAGAAK
jgi:hypothetical protein